MHADHFLDLVPYAYALTYAPRQQPVPVARWPGTDNPARPQLHVPAGGRDVLRRVVGAWGNEDLVEKAFELREYETDDVLEIGSLRVRFHEVPHFVETNAVDITTTNGDGRFTFGADSRPVRGAPGVRPGHRPVAARGHAAAPRARWPPGPPDARRRRAITLAAPRPIASSSRISRTSSTSSGRATRRRRRSARRSRSPARARSTPSEQSTSEPFPDPPVLLGLRRAGRAARPGRRRGRWATRHAVAGARAPTY